MQQFLISFHKSNNLKYHLLKALVCKRNIQHSVDKENDDSVCKRYALNTDAGVSALHVLVTILTLAVWNCTCR